MKRAGVPSPAAEVLTYFSLLIILGERVRVRTKKVPSKWERDHLKRRKRSLDQRNKGAKCSTLFCYFWFSNFEVFSLIHKNKNWFYLLLIFFPLLWMK